MPTKTKPKRVTVIEGLARLIDTLEADALKMRDRHSRAEDPQSWHAWDERAVAYRFAAATLRTEDARRAR